MKVVEDTKNISKESFDTETIDILRDDYKEETQKEKNQISQEFSSLARNNISTASALEIQDGYRRTEYESKAIEFNENQKSKEIGRNSSKKAIVEKQKIGFVTDSSGKAKSISDKAGQNTGKSGGKWQAALNLQKSLTPEELKARNYTAKKNSERIRYLSESPDNVEKETTNKVASIFSKRFNKLREIYVNNAILAWNINWIAGLCCTVVPLLIALLCFMLFVVRLGIDTLPPWAYTSQYTVRQLMTNYEYYWDCANIEVSASVENKISTNSKKAIAIPVAYDEEDELSAENAIGKNFINWREVLAVYYAGLHDETALPDNELYELSSGKYIVNSQFTEDNSSYFNQVFWTMNCIMPTGNVLNYQEDIVPSSGISIVAYNLCYKPSLEQVEARLGFNPIQRSLVQMYLSTEYDFYFDELIENRYISSNQLVVDIAAAEVSKDNHGQKYKEWIGYDCQWCNTYVNWCLTKSGNSRFVASNGVTSSLSYYVQHPELATIHYVSGFGSNAKSVKQINPQPGWLIIFDNNPKDSIRTHIGIVESYDSKNDVVISLEGNTRHELNRPAGGNYVARMHRASNKGNICCFVELKYPNASKNVSARYSKNYCEKTRMSDSNYNAWLKAADKHIKTESYIEYTLGTCDSLLVNGLPEWTLMHGLTYLPGTVVLDKSSSPILIMQRAYITGSAEDKAKYNNLGLTTIKYLLPNHFTEYCLYYRKTVL